MKTLEQLGISPAPWEIDNWSECWLIVRDAKGRYAATPDGDEETEAIPNAHLIAAAPDLYDALYDVIDYCESTHLVPSERFGKVLAKVKAALAKAGGESEVSN